MEIPTGPLTRDAAQALEDRLRRLEAALGNLPPAMLQGGRFTGNNVTEDALNVAFRAKLTAAGTAVDNSGATVTVYAWTEEDPLAGAALWADATGRRSGTTSRDPAREANGIAVTVGTVVELRRAYYDPALGWVHTFDAPGSSGSGSTTTLTLPQKVCVLSGGQIETQFQAYQFQGTVTPVGQPFCQASDTSCCGPPPNPNPSGCCGCPPNSMPPCWQLTIAGVTDGSRCAGSVPCAGISCGCNTTWNGTWTLGLGLGCTWTASNPGLKVGCDAYCEDDSAYITFACDASGNWYVALSWANPHGSACANTLLYYLAPGATLNCNGSNTFHKAGWSFNTVTDYPCDNFPATLTLTPKSPCSGSSGPGGGGGSCCGCSVTSAAWKWTLSGLTNNFCTDCANMNVTWNANGFSAPCTWYALSGAVICGTFGVSASLTCNAGGYWSVQFYLSGTGNVIAEYRCPIANFNCLTGGTFTKQSSDSNCATWPATLAVTNA